MEKLISKKKSENQKPQVNEECNVEQSTDTQTSPRVVRMFKNTTKADCIALILQAREKYTMMLTALYGASDCANDNYGRIVVLKGNFDILTNRLIETILIELDDLKP